MRLATNTSTAPLPGLSGADAAAAVEEMTAPAATTAAAAALMLWKYWIGTTRYFQAGCSMSKQNFAAVMAAAMMLDHRLSLDFWAAGSEGQKFGLLCSAGSGNDIDGHPRRLPATVKFGNVEEMETPSRTLYPWEAKEPQDLVGLIYGAINTLIPGPAQICCHFENPMSAMNPF